MKSSLRIYGHLVSQPTRAVVWACRMNQTPFQFIEIDPSRGQTREPEFLSKFRYPFIPAIEVGEAGAFRLQESHAILVYLAKKFNWTKCGLPSSSLEDEARVHEYLHWHHLSTRANTLLLFRPWLFGALRRQMPPPTIDVKRLKALERHWKTLNKELSESKFLAHQTNCTIADVAAYCEFDQLVALQRAWPELKMSLSLDGNGNEHIRRWMEAMRQLPFHDDVREPLLQICSYVAHQAKKTEAKL